MEKPRGSPRVSSCIFDPSVNRSGLAEIRAALHRTALKALHGRTEPVEKAAQRIRRQLGGQFAARRAARLIHASYFCGSSCGCLMLAALIIGHHRSISPF
jgi:hypothetical protein